MFSTILTLIFMGGFAYGSYNYGLVCGYEQKEKDDKEVESLWWLK